jgi:hypothetical protein
LSVADAAGLQVNDRLVNINGVDVRKLKYEKVSTTVDIDVSYCSTCADVIIQVVAMLVSAMQTDETIDMCVSNSHHRVTDRASSSCNTNINNNSNDHHQHHSIATSSTCLGTAMISSNDTCSDMHSLPSSVQQLSTNSSPRIDTIQSAGKCPFSMSNTSLPID